MHLLTLGAQNEEKAIQPTATELATIRADNPAEPPRKRKGPKGPNPLSVKKKAVPRARQPAPTTGSDKAESVTGQKRKSTDVEHETTTPTARKRKRRMKHASTSETLNLVSL